jgi:hypothetical protein
MCFSQKLHRRVGSISASIREVTNSSMGTKVGYRRVFLVFFLTSSKFRDCRPTSYDTTTAFFSAILIYLISH